MGKNEIVGYEPLVDDLKDLIHKKQYQVLKLINSETINLYWEIGEEIYRQQEENGWGKSIVQVLSTELQKEFPGAKGYSAANLWRMRNFYLTYRDSEKLAPLVREISWSNNIIIMEKCKDDLQREFYIQMVKRYGWTKRILTNFIEAQTYEKYLLNQTNFDLTLPVEQSVKAKLIMMLFVVILKLRYVFLRRTEDNEKYENRKCIKTYIKDGNANGYINDGKFVV